MRKAEAWSGCGHRRGRCVPISRATSESIYELLVNEEDARACADIPEAACRETPRSFVLILLANFLTKVGDAIASPKTVLSWVMASVQAPTALIGFLVPIRESGSLIPQLFIASWVRRLAVRKWVWIVGALLQAAADRAGRSDGQHRGSTPAEVGRPSQENSARRHGQRLTRRVGCMGHGVIARHCPSDRRRSGVCAGRQEAVP
jgi:hypothetical protein